MDNKKLLEEVNGRLEEVVNDILIDMQKNLGITDGACNPWTALELDNTTTALAENIVKLLEEQKAADLIENIEDLTPLNIETYYTGGGVWITEAALKGGRYAAITSDFVTCLTVYKDAAEKFMNDDMIFSKALEELEENEMQLYKKMLEDMNNKR